MEVSIGECRGTSLIGRAVLARSRLGAILDTLKALRSESGCGCGRTSFSFSAGGGGVCRQRTASLVHYVDIGIASTGGGADRQVEVHGGTFKEIVNVRMSLILLFLLALVVV
jgi:hypothetical protein